MPHVGGLILCTADTAGCCARCAVGREGLMTMTREGAQGFMKATIKHSGNKIMGEVIRKEN